MKKSPLGEKMIGAKYGRLTVVRNMGYISGHYNTPKYIVEAKCECGFIILCPIGRIRNGNTKSCGCLAKDETSKRSTTHGHKNRKIYGENGSSLYFIWGGVKQRCLNPKHAAYHRYGGRGITICDRWKDSFDNFLQDMGGSYKSKLTLERVDNNKGYCPENCRWATMKEQANNTNTNKHITYNGETLTITQAAEKYGLSYSLLVTRISTYKWSIEKALTTQVAKDLVVDYMGERITVTNLANRIGMKVSTLRGRIVNYKWSVEKSVTFPVRDINRKYIHGFKSVKKY